MQYSFQESATLFSSSALDFASGAEDPTSRVVKKIFAVTKWAPPAFAHRISVPVTCIEACLAQNVSSQLLRSQLRRWVRNGQGLPALPAHDFQVLVRDADAREAAQNDDSVFAQLDDPTREHFEYLQRSIGHNFVAILNDPESKQQAGSWGAAGNDWGTWINRTFMGASPLQASPAVDAARVQASIAAATAEGSQYEFDAYLGSVTQPYRFRRELDKEGRASVLLPSGEQQGDEENLKPPPLPDKVSLEFASDDFDVARVLRGVLNTRSGDDGELLNVIEVMMKGLDDQHDAVAVALMTHVHSRSRDFFLASQLFEELTQETRGALETADATRNDVQSGGVPLVHSFLRIAQMSRRRRNCAGLLWTVDELRGQAQLMNAIDGALAERKFARAARALKTAEASIHTFDAYRALDGAKRKLIMRQRDVKHLVAEAVRRWVHFDEWGEIDWPALGDALHAAERLGCLADVIAGYAVEAAAGTIDAVLRPLVARGLVPPTATLRALRLAADDPTSARDPLKEVASSARRLVATAVHHLKPQAFQAVLTDVLAGLDEHFKLCVGHAAIVTEAMDAAAQEDCDDGGSPPGNTDRHHGWMQQVVSAVAAESQERALWFFDCRDDESVVSFSAPGIDRFVGDALTQIAALEQSATDQWLLIGGAPSKDAPGLWSKVRACIGQHVKMFFKRHHDRLFERMMAVLSTEKWEPQLSVARTFVTYASMLTVSDDASIRTVLGAAHNITGKADELPKLPDAPPATPLTPVSIQDLLTFPGLESKGTGSAGPSDLSTNDDGMFLTLPGVPDRYSATNALLLLLQMLAEYDWFNRRFPLLSHDVAARIHDALKLFDGQCSALVLGEGAVHQGALEAVLPKHYAVAVQSVAFLAALTPRLQRRLARLSNAKSMGFTKNLERVARELADHRTEFFVKLVEIFRQRVQGYTVEPAAWGAKGNAWVLVLLKECLKYWVKGLKPLMGHCAIAERSVVIGLVNAMSHRIREVAVQITDETDIAKLRQDLLVYKTNVEKILGYGVVACGAVRTLAAAANATNAALDPQGGLEQDAAVLEYLGCGASLDV
jgi:vacuolar protein sorting-associated protein 54